MCTPFHPLPNIQTTRSPASVNPQTLKKPFLEKNPYFFISNNPLNS